MAEKKTGELAFDIGSGKFWIMSEGAPVTDIDFGDKFEVKVEGNWVETGLEISSGNDGELVFKLKNTSFSGDIEGLEVRM